MTCWFNGLNGKTASSATNLWPESTPKIRSGCAVSLQGVDRATWTSRLSGAPTAQMSYAAACSHAARVE